MSDFSEVCQSIQVTILGYLLIILSSPSVMKINGILFYKLQNLAHFDRNSNVEGTFLQSISRKMENIKYRQTRLEKSGGCLDPTRDQDCHPAYEFTSYSASEVRKGIHSGNNLTCQTKTLVWKFMT